MRSLHPLALGALASLAFACGGNEAGLGPGEACVRSFECAPGLACVAQVCSGDPSEIGGEVPTPEVDMGIGDMGDVGDLGPQPDMGPPPDMGPQPDLGMPEDMFTPPEDMFTPPEDMFTPEPDMFTDVDGG